MKWRVGSRGRIYDPGEDTVVYYDTDSGDTHLLNDFAAFVISQLGSQTLTVAALTKQISPAIEPGQIPDIESAVDEVVRELSTLGILKQT